MVSRASLRSSVLSPANVRGLLVACLCICAAIIHAETPGSSTFAPTIPNKTPAPRPAPEGMVWISGGEFSMGAAMNGQGSNEMPMASNDSGPVHRVRVDGFWMDTTPVSNEQFVKFVKATGYITIAERTPT
jgi:sulfatase modifying factor 1